jgi:hypothetical protein
MYPLSANARINFQAGYAESILAVQHFGCLIVQPSIGGQERQVKAIISVGSEVW